MRHSSLKMAMASGLILAAGAAGAQEPAAIVEDASDKITAVQFMDYLPPGKVIALAAADELTIGYIRSCWREVIRGGIVTVGTEQSVVVGGQVRRQKVECDGGRMRLTAQQAGQSGVMVFRRAPAAGTTQTAAAPRPQVLLHGASPMVELKAPGPLLIERLDKSGERREINVAATQLVHGSFYDFARNNQSLQPGGLYRATAGGQQVVFQVDSKAKPGSTPVVGRLLKF